MTPDIINIHLTLQRLQRKHVHLMKPHFIPNEFTEDPLNSHYDDRRTWLAWRDVAPPRESARRRLGMRLVRIGRWLEGSGASNPAIQA